LENGIVPGGGAAFLHAAKSIRPNFAALNGDTLTGALILSSALSAPLRQIVDNSGANGRVVCEKVLDSNNTSWGYDALECRYCDLFKAGIADPLNVALIALRSAVSMASTLITTNAMVFSGKTDPAALSCES
jgi:chaperonin GroEL